MGCFLILTEKGFRQIVGQIQEHASELGARWEILDYRLKQGGPAQRAAFTALVKHPGLDLVQLVRALGRPEVPAELATPLPAALALIVSEHPDATGLFHPHPSYWGKGATALLDDLASKSKPQGSAYEILGTVALMQREVQDKTGMGALGLYSTDRPHFGRKLQSQHFGDPTIEADLLIERGNLLTGIRLIGIDFCYTSGGTYSWDKERVAQGAAHAIQDGQVTEFHFVTNGKFDFGFIHDVKEANKELIESGNPVIRLYEHVGPGRLPDRVS